MLGLKFLCAYVIAGFLSMDQGKDLSGTPVIKKIIDENLYSVVEVEANVSITLTFQNGQTRDQNRKISTSGVLLDNSGLIVSQSAARQINTNVGYTLGEPIYNNIKIRFADDTEVEGNAVGVESDLSLLFLRVAKVDEIKSQLAPISMTKLNKGEKPFSIGDIAYVLNIHEASFKNRPRVRQLKIESVLDEPLTCFLHDRDSVATPAPVFDHKGNCVGLSVTYMFPDTVVSYRFPTRQMPVIVTFKYLYKVIQDMGKKAPVTE